jgi:hypothetical protein
MAEQKSYPQLRRHLAQQLCFLGRGLKKAFLELFPLELPLIF